jgi:thiol-disulfide isomerase/thioredoxin
MDIAEKHDWFHPLVPINCSAFALPVFMRVSCVMPIPKRYAYQSGDPLRQRLDALDSIALSPVNRELYATQYFLEWIDALSSPLSASQMEYLPQFVHSPYLLKRIQKKNMEFIAYVEAARASRDKSPLAGTPASLRVAESELEGLTDGREIFERIIAPLRGRIVYVDVWGTWCGPCKEALSHSTEEYARLKDYDIEFLYLANRSPQDSWENVIKEYNVSGPNVAHYNLPDEQQAAIERHLNVHSWPTYKLFNRDGHLLDIEVDARNLDELARLLEQMK